MTGYKFLRRDGRAPISEHAWPKPGEWIQCDGPLVQCKNGIHILRADDLAHWLSTELWLVEHEGERIDAADCLVVRRARLVRRVDTWCDGGAERFARAARQHFAELVERSPVEQQPLLREILDDCDYDLREHDWLMTSYAAAMGFARFAADPQRAYRDERAWQSAWIAKDLALV